MVVADVLTHQPFQMPLVKHNYMIKQVASAIANPAFGDAVLPRTSEADSFRLDAEARYGADNFTVEVRYPVEDQIAGGRIIRECFAKLLRDPLATWMTEHVAVEDASPAMRDDEEAVVLALRQQLAVLKAKHPQPRLALSDQLFWVVLRRLWSGWKEALVIVRPETVIRWHRAGLLLPIMRDGRDYSLAMSAHPGTSLSVFQTGRPRSCASRTSSSAPLEDPGSRNTASQRMMSRFAMG
jgi:hypothetical protein